MGWGLRLGYLLRGSHEVDGCVVMVVFLDETEGELIVDQQVVCAAERTRDPEKLFKNRCIV